MHPALVRLSSVVALAVPLATFPALAAAAAPPVGTVLVSRPASDASPPADDPGAPPDHDMEGMDRSDPWAVEHSHDEAPVDEHADEHDGEHGADPGDEHGADPGDEHGGHTGPAPAAPDRPRTEVLSAFGALNGAVLVSAALLRRRERNHPRHRPRAGADLSAADRRSTSR